VNVYFPHGGVWRLLRWHTRNTGHHVVLAKSERAMDGVVRRLVDREPFAEIADHLLVEIVAPSDAMVAAKRAYEESRTRQGFWSYVCGSAKHADVLPDELMMCDRFEPDDEYATADDHYGCRNCHEGIVPRAETTDDFYAARRAAYEELFPPFVDGVPSRARRARDDEAVCAAGASFGPHRSGVGLGPTTPEETAYETPLFLYLPLGQLDTSPYERLFAGAVAAIRAEQARHDAEWREQIARRRRQEAADLAAVLRRK